MLSLEHYKQPVRAFVLDMFDLQLTGEVIAEFLELDAHHSTAAALAPLLDEPLKQNGDSHFMTGLRSSEPEQAESRPVATMLESTQVRDNRNKPPARFIAGFQ
jgi:hypothetical protein